MLQLKCIAQKGEESVVGYSGGENKHLTVVLSVTADGQMLSSKFIFRERTHRTICKLHIPPGLVVKRQEMAWMDDNLMKVWTEEICLKYIQAECKKPRFQNSMLHFDAFAAHLTDEVKINY